MEKDGFIEDLDKRISKLEDQRAAHVQNSLDGRWHSSQIHDALDTALEQVNNEIEGKDEIISALLNIIDQVPNFVLRVWENNIHAVKALDAEKRNVQGMQRFYSEYLEDKKKEEEAKKLKEIVRNPPPAPPNLSDEVVAGIESGVIQEPSVMAGVRRKAGTRPPVTLKNYRNHKSEESAEQENALDDSQG